MIRYKALPAITQQAEQHQPLAPPEPRWFAIAKIIISVTLALTVILLARTVAAYILAHMDVQDFKTLIVLLLSLTGLIPLLLGISVFFERLGRC